MRLLIDLGICFNMEGGWLDLLSTWSGTSLGFLNGMNFLIQLRCIEEKLWLIKSDLKKQLNKESAVKRLAFRIRHVASVFRIQKICLIVYGVMHSLPILSVLGSLCIRCSFTRQGFILKSVRY